MNRINNKQREHIVREAVAQRDAILAGNAPRKLWLWKNFVDGRPEYWAFDNPFPIHLTDGDPQTLGEPCGYALFKPSRQGRTDVSEEEVLRRVGLKPQPCSHHYVRDEDAPRYHCCQKCGKVVKEP
jgi:hypothetical protein